MKNIFLFQPSELSNYLKKFQELIVVGTQVEQFGINGIDFFKNSVQAFLELIDCQCDDQILSILINIKNENIQKLNTNQHHIDSKQVYVGCITKIDQTQLHICCPTYSTPIMQINTETTQINNISGKIQLGQIAEVIIQKDKVIKVLIHNRENYISPNLDYLLYSREYTDLPENYSESNSSLHLDEANPPGLQDPNLNAFMPQYDPLSNNISLEPDLIFQTSILPASSPFQLPPAHPGPQMASDFINPLVDQFFSQQINPLQSLTQQQLTLMAGQHNQISQPLATKFTFKENTSNINSTKLSTKPTLIQQFGEVTNIKLIGRVDFLIDQTIFIIVPLHITEKVKYMPNITFTEDDIQACRDFKVSTELGIVVSANNHIATIIEPPYNAASVVNGKAKNDPIIRGDIVEFELVPGYSFNYVNQFSQANPSYPFIGDKQLFNQQNQAANSQHLLFTKQVIQDFDDIFKAASNTEVLMPYANNIKVVDRIDKSIVSKKHLIHGVSYIGYVYTFNDQDGYGFIKSYGNLEQARDYSQGFEVYFKLQTSQRMSYVPQRGDLVRFKSHWVDEKAQARAIELVQKNDQQQQMKGQCIGISPPYAIFNNSSSCEELKNNLFFVKLKGLAVPIRLGQVIMYQFDPDISSHFRASNLQNEQAVSKSAVSFSLSASPSKTQTILQIKPLPWDDCFYFSKQHPVFKSLFIVSPIENGKIILFDVIEEKPILKISMLGYEFECQNILLPVTQKGHPQYLALYNPQYQQKFAIVAGTTYDNFVYKGISDEYVFFQSQLFNNIGFAVKRAQVPNYIIYKQNIKVTTQLQTDIQYQCLFHKNVNYLLVQQAQFE